ncbi:MAG: transglutaminase-like domain-containing protein [Candidatus Thermoplasmatota archaeon]
MLYTEDINTIETNYSIIIMQRQVAFFIVIFMVCSAVAPMVSSSQPVTIDADHSFKLNNITDAGQDTEVYLLRGEHYLYLSAQEATDAFTVLFSYPPQYGYQVPIYLEIHNDTTEKLLGYQIEDDINKPNKVIQFHIDSLDKHALVLLHFSCYVVVQNHDFSDLSDNVRFPRRWQLPKDTRVWLSSSKVVQVHSFLIQRKAQQLRGIQNNMISYAKDVAWFIRHHRYGLFVLQLNLGVFFSQDARTTLLIGGENVGRSHLACALFRSQNIPARVILAHNDQGFWTQMHYMVEYYVPGYGWVLLDSTRGETPYATKHQIINRICYPSDEQDTKTDYIFKRMKGEERWLWINTSAVTPYYVDCKTGSKSQMFQEGVVSTDTFTSEYTVFFTGVVFRLYQQYLGLNLTGDNKLHFEQAVLYQQKALKEFSENQDIHGYLLNLDLAYGEYKQIII